MALDSVRSQLINQANSIRRNLPKDSVCHWSFGEALNKLRDQVIALYSLEEQILIVRLVEPIDIRREAPYTVYTANARLVCDQLISFLTESVGEPTSKSMGDIDSDFTKVEDLAKRKRGVLLWHMTTYFDSNDLENMCFIMGIEYENLRGSEKMSKAREIILHCERTGRIAELLELCRRVRPNVSW